VPVPKALVLKVELVVVGDLKMVEGCYYGLYCFAEEWCLWLNVVVSDPAFELIQAC